jgi:hypothetical protein
MKKGTEPAPASISRQTFPRFVRQRTVAMGIKARTSSCDPMLFWS